MKRRSLLRVGGLLGLAALPLPLSGCGEKEKRSDRAADEGLTFGLPLVTRDVLQVRKGLPEGALALQLKLPDDPAGSRLPLQQAIAQSRAKSDNLSFAKITFLAFATTEGVVLRSEIDPDRLVEQNLVKAYPGLAKAADAKSGIVEAFGELDALRGVKRGPDTAWVLAHPLLAEDSSVRGLLVTGWSMRLYVRSLEQQVRAKLADVGKERNDKTIPVAYVYLLKGDQAYGDPDGPDVTAEALGKLALPEKTQNGRIALRHEIDKRQFSIAAERVPEFGGDFTLCVVASAY